MTDKTVGRFSNEFPKAADNVVSEIAVTASEISMK